MKPALERIARALCSADGLPENTKFDGRPMWESFLPKARAALCAIRVPTEEMTKAGKRLLGEERGELVSDNDLRDAWVVMVDASLSEGP